MGWGFGIGGDAVRCEEGEDLGLGEVETEGFEGDFEFVVVDSLVLVEVEEAELRSARVSSCDVHSWGVFWLRRSVDMGTYGFVDLLFLLVG